MMHKYEPKSMKVAVVGGSGYAGLELVRLLLKHPIASLRVCFTTQPGLSFSDYLPVRGAKVVPVAPVGDIEKWASELDTVFLATPAEASMDLAPRLLASGAHVVDLSGAFRLGSAAEYREWYGAEHACPALLGKAEYGLLPWVEEKAPAEGAARLVANPGCYATSVLMALLPLLKRGLVKPDSIVIDAKSGTSGAGRKASVNLLFTEVEGECLPYRIARHQHLPEIKRFAEALSGTAIDPLFTTHLLGIRRGIISGIYARLGAAVTQLDLSSAYANDYSDYGLVEWGPLEGLTERSAAHQLSLKRVVGTALTRIHYQIDGDRLYLFSLIDNLVKGAAGQAIENFNRLHGMAAGTGLTDLEGVL